MLAILIFSASWHLALGYAGSILLASCVHVATLLLLLTQMPVGLPALRTSRFASFVRRCLVGVEFEPKSLARLRRLDPNDRFAVIVDPHGAKTLAMAMTLSAPGHDATPLELVNKCVVVAHWLVFLIPFVAQLFALCGVIPARPSIFLRRALDAGCHFAVCPSGMEGKAASLQRHNDLKQLKVNGKRVIHVVRRKKRLGFCSYATKHKMKLLPFLSLNEEEAFYNCGVWLRLAPLIYPLGWMLFFPRCASMQVRVGEPIDTTKYNGDDDASMNALADVYYKALETLAEPDHTIVFE